MLLYLIRHPAPLIEAGVCYGVSDIPAKPEALAECLTVLLPQLHSLSLNGVHIYTSPLQRCTALAFALHTALPASTLAICPELCELDFGRWEGLEWNTIHDTDEHGLDAWAAHPMSYAPGGGESLTHMHQRVIAWLTTINKNKVEQAIVVTHGGPLRVLLSTHKNKPEAALTIQAPPWGSLTVIEITL